MLAASDDLSISLASASDAALMRARPPQPPDAVQHAAHAEIRVQQHDAAAFRGVREQRAELPLIECAQRRRVQDERIDARVGRRVTRQVVRIERDRVKAFEVDRVAGHEAHAEQRGLRLRNADVAPLRRCGRRSGAHRDLFGRVDRHLQPHDSAGLEVEVGAHDLAAGRDVERRSRCNVGAQANVDFGRPARTGPAVPRGRRCQVDARLGDRVRHAAEREPQKPWPARHCVT